MARVPGIIIGRLNFFWGKKKRVRPSPWPGATATTDWRGIFMKNIKPTHQAGKEYREGGLYDEALRCYGTIGDEQGIARVYEKQNNLEGALKIWKRLGHRREITRLQKKVDKIKGPGGQLTLFEGKRK